MKASFAAGVFVVSLTLANTAAAETLGYPSMEKASFLLDYPDDWAMVPGDNEGDYVSLASASGVSLQLRTVEGSESVMDQVIAENVQFLEDNFTQVEIGDAKDIDTDGGLTGSLVQGTGIDSDKKAVNFSIFFVTLPDGKIADIWYSAFKGDSEGSKAAAAVLDSFRTR
jgi:hypothetical protein